MYKQLRDDHDAAREALQGHAGLRVHDRGRASSTCSRPGTASAPAMRPCASRSTWSRRSSSRRARRCCGSSRRRCRSCCRRSSIRRRGRARRWRPGPAGLARRGVRPGRLHGRGRRRVDAAGQEGAARSQGNRARRRPRHARGAGHPHRDRRHDLPRGGRRTPDGASPRSSAAARSQINEKDKTVHRRRHRRVKAGDWLSFDGLTGEVMIGQVATKPSEILQVARRQDEAGGSDIYQRFDRLLTWADKDRTLGSAPTPTCPTRRSWPTRSARAASACAAPSTCSSARAASRRAEDDPRRQRGGPAARRSRAAAAPARATSSASSRRCTASRSPSA